MTRRRPRTSRCHDDSGASLILALMIITGVALVAGAMLSYSGTAITSAGATLARAQTDYDVDGALQVAVNTIRQSDFINTPGQNCINAAHLLTYQGDPGRPRGQVAVSCSPKAGTGGGNGGSGFGSANKPAYGLLTLGTNSLDGIDQSGNSIFRIRGRAHSNAGISVRGNGQLLDLNGQVTARLSCSGQILSTPGPTQCSTGTNAADPGYAQPSAAVPLRTAPSCASSPGGTVTLQPGFYTDVAPLNALTTSCGKAVLFTSGTYVFDFRNSGPATSRVWRTTQSGGPVVGGIPNGWNPASATTPTITMPGSCVSPFASQSNGGVQFLFGGDSQWSLAAGSRVELCGPWSATRPPIVLQGATTTQQPPGGPPGGIRSQTEVGNGSTGCVSSGSSCPLLTTRGTNTALFLQGTVYAPVALLDVQAPNATVPVFRAGVIVRALDLTLPASFSSTTPIIDLPDDSPGSTPVEVYLTAYLCPPAGCSGNPPGNPSWPIGGRAVVAFSAGTSGHRTVAVRAWRIQR